jgi:crossover junction endodeoxyribonuclease RusA
MIVLPFPPFALNPNKRQHWSVTAKAKKLYREACYILTKQSGAKVDWDGDVHAWIDFYPPDRRARDDDNMIAAFKAGRDGMADALGIDDKRIRIHPYVKNEVGGMVKIKLTKGEEHRVNT